MKILLVGLDGPIGDVVGGWLRASGHGVEACLAGEEMLSANRWCPDVIFFKPGTAGALAQFVGWLRARYRLAETRVIAVLPEDGAPSAIDCLRAGAAEVVVSPLARSDLKARLEIIGAESDLRSQLARAQTEAAAARAELERTQKAAADATANVEESERERAWLAKDLERARAELNEKAARAADLDRNLNEITARLEKSLGDLSAETTRASALLAESGRSAVLEKEVQELRAALAELNQKHSEVEARVSSEGATSEALDKTRSELRALRVEFGESQRLPIRLFEATGSALSEGLILLERTAPDGEPKVIYANAAFERLTGRTKADQLGMPLWFPAADANLDWKENDPLVFHREEPKEDGGTRRLRIEVMPVPAIVGGRSFWAMILTEEVTEIVLRAQAPPPPEKALGEPPVAMISPTPRKVLLARDGGPLNPRLVGVLRDSGFNVAIGEPNSGAMEKSQPGDFDLMVLEINRPGSAGPGMLRLTRQRLPDQKVMIVSRLLTLRQKHEVERLGVAMIVTEELSGSELLKRIEAVLADAVDAACGQPEPVARRFDHPRAP